MAYFKDRAYSLADFEYIIYKQIHAATQTLQNKYFEEVKNIFIYNSKKGRLPKASLVNRTKKFYNCVATIMKYHLQSLCLNSLSEYTYFLHDIGVRNLNIIPINYKLCNKIRSGQLSCKTVTIPLDKIRSSTLT